MGFGKVEMDRNTVLHSNVSCDGSYIHICLNGITSNIVCFSVHMDLLSVLLKANLRYSSYIHVCFFRRLKC